MLKTNLELKVKRLCTIFITNLYKRDYYWIQNFSVQVYKLLLSLNYSMYLYLDKKPIESNENGQIKSPLSTKTSSSRLRSPYRRGSPARGVGKRACSPAPASTKTASPSLTRKLGKFFK